MSSSTHIDLINSCIDTHNLKRLRQFVDHMVFNNEEYWAVSYWATPSKARKEFSEELLNIMERCAEGNKLDVMTCLFPLMSDGEIQHLFFTCARLGYRDAWLTVKDSRENNKYLIDTCFKTIAKHGHAHMVDAVVPLIELEDTMSHALIVATTHEQFDLIETLTPYASPKSLGFALMAASRGNSMRAVTYFLSKLETEPVSMHITLAFFSSKNQDMAEFLAQHMNWTPEYDMVYKHYREPVEPFHHQIYRAVRDQQALNNSVPFDHSAKQQNVRKKI